MKTLKDEAGRQHVRICGRAEIHGTVRVDKREKLLEQMHEREIENALNGATAAKRAGVGLHMIGGLLG